MREGFADASGEQAKARDIWYVRTVYALHYSPNAGARGLSVAHCTVSIVITCQLPHRCLWPSSIAQLHPHKVIAAREARVGRK